MSEEERVRTLLAAAAELRGLRPAPVERLMATGRRHRRRSRVLAAASAAVAVAVALTTGALLGGHSAAHPSSSVRLPTGSAEALARDHWSQLPNDPLGNPDFAEWTGRELFVVDAHSEVSGPIVGAAYIPGTGWHRTAQSPARLDNSRFTTLGWAGTDLVVVYSGPGAEIAIAIFSPATNQWRVSRALSPTLGGQAVEAAGDTGINLIGRIGDQVVLVREIRNHVYAYRYDLATGTWSQRGYLVAPSICQASRCTAPNGVMSYAIAAGRVVVWWHVGAGQVSVHAIEPDGAWRTVEGWPRDVTGFRVFSSDNGQIVLTRTITHGRGQSAVETTEGYLVDPVSLSVRALGFMARGRYREFEPAEWTGSALIAMAWNQNVSPPEQTFGGYAIDAMDPAAGRWFGLPPGTIVDSFVWGGPIWGGSQLFVFDGNRLWSLHP